MRPVLINYNNDKTSTEENELVFVQSFFFFSLKLQSSLFNVSKLLRPRFETIASCIHLVRVAINIFRI